MNAIAANRRQIRACPAKSRAEPVVHYTPLARLEDRWSSPRLEGWRGDLVKIALLIPHRQLKHAEAGR